MMDAAVNRPTRLVHNIGDACHDIKTLEGRNLRVALVRHKRLDNYAAEAASDHCIAFSLRQHGPALRYYGSRVSGTSEHARTATILPAGYETSWQCDEHTEVLHAYLDANVLRRHINDTHDVDPDTIQLQDLMGVPDTFLGRLAPILLQQLAEPGHTTQLMLDGIEQVIAAHVLGSYSSGVKRSGSAATLDQASVAKVIDFMRANLEQDISLEDLASQTSLSLFTFARAFKDTTGVSPHQMLLAERVNHAAELLRDPQLTLAEIAYTVGFSSQSHMTTTFAKQMGVTPGRYRKDILG